MSGVLPADTRIGAGSVTVDLTRGELPTTGRSQVRVGMGTVVVLMPPGAAGRVNAEVVTGSITVDGTRDGGRGATGGARADRAGSRSPVWPRPYERISA